MAVEPYFSTGSAGADSARYGACALRTRTRYRLHVCISFEFLELEALKDLFSILSNISIFVLYLIAFLQCPYTMNLLT